MFDFSALKLVVGAKESFVGIRKSEDLDTYEFCLPKGFDDFAKYQSDFNNVRDFFFLMYRTLRKFSQDSLYSSRFQRNDAKSQTSQDQPTLSSGGISLKTNDEEEEGSDDILLYSKLNMIERVLEAYDDLALHSIQKKIRRTEEIDYSKIHKYLDRAIYLDYSEEEHTIYIEAMDLPRSIIHYESTDIIHLYCFILDEIIQQLQEDVPENVQDRSQDIRFLSQRFRDDYLTNNQSLFSQDTFEETITILKEALDNIDRNTHYKDADYWGLYEAIETFLYGELNPGQEDGEFWGIKGEQGFSYVWEDMCNTYFFIKNFDPIQQKFNKICFADADIIINGYINKQINSLDKNYRRLEDEKNRVGNRSKPIRHNNSSDESENRWTYQIESNLYHPYYNRNLWWGELFCIELDLNSGFVNTDKKIQRYSSSNRSLYYRRYPQPDLVMEEEINGQKTLKLIDYKNHSLQFYQDNSQLPIEKTDENKYMIPLAKQLTYELALQQSFPEHIIENIFFIPFYYLSTPEYPLGKTEPNFEIRGIKIFKANFYLIQEVYLNSGNLENS
jgi:hypothetical protein